MITRAGGEIIWDNLKAPKPKAPRRGASFGDTPGLCGGDMMKSGSPEPPNGIIAILIG